MGLNELSGREIIRQIASGETSAESATRACLERIGEREPAVGAWSHLDPDGALRAAQRCDAAAVRGPLAGLCVGVKDIIETADMPTAYGSPIYAGHRPAADAACVALLRAAGAIVLGKTVTAEFATLKPGKTRHPLAPDRTPGGSSSGSAAAVADRMVHVALGTQTMGSVIRPASYCGVVSYKPSFGFISYAGVKPEAESIDTLGMFARTVDDVALLAAVLMGAPPGAFDGNVSQPPRICVYRGPDWSSVEPAAERVLDAAVQRLAAAGATIENAGQPEILRSALDAQLTVLLYELARAFSYEWNAKRELLSPQLVELIQTGLGISFETYRAARRLAAEARGWMTEQFTRSDLWLTLSATGEAPLGLASTGDPILNRLWSLLRTPAMTLPAGRGANDLPIGVQLIGPYGRDAAFLAAARWVAAAL